MGPIESAVLSHAQRKSERRDALIGCEQQGRVYVEPDANAVSSAVVFPANVTRLSGRGQPWTRPCSQSALYPFPNR